MKNNAWFIFLILLLFCVSLHAATLHQDVIIDDYNANKEAILKKGYKITANYVIGVGCTQIRNNRAIAEREAGLLASSNILRALGSETEITDLPPYVSENNAKKILELYKLISSKNASLQNQIELSKFTKKEDKRTFLFHVVAYRRSDIRSKIPKQAPWIQIYRTVANNQACDAFLLWEVSSEQERKTSKRTIETQLQKQKGRNFSNQFFSYYVARAAMDVRKKMQEEIAKCTADTSLQDLVVLADRLPYDTVVTKLLVEKFKTLDLPSCAAQMNKAMQICHALDAEEERQRKAEEARMAAQKAAEEAAERACAKAAVKKKINKIVRQFVPVKTTTPAEPVFEEDTENITDPVPPPAVKVPSAPRPAEKQPAPAVPVILEEETSPAVKTPSAPRPAAKQPAPAVPVILEEETSPAVKTPSAPRPVEKQPAPAVPVILEEEQNFLPDAAPVRKSPILQPQPVKQQPVVPVKPVQLF